MIARASGEHEEIRRLPFAFHAKPRLLSTRLDRHDMRLLHFAACAQRPVQQESVQNFARVDDDGIGHFERCALIVARNQFNGVNQFFGMRIFQQEGIFLNRFVRQPAAARFFPRQVLVKNGHFVPGARQLLAAHGSRRPSADYRYL